MNYTLQDIRQYLTDIYIETAMKAEKARNTEHTSTMQYFLGRKAGLKIAIDIIDKILENE